LIGERVIRGTAKKALLVQSQAHRQQYGANSIFLLPSADVQAHLSRAWPAPLAANEALARTRR
jgi:hypothetical protein